MDQKTKSYQHHLKDTIGVMGGASPQEIEPCVARKAEEVGREIARQGYVLITGATTGYPFYACKGAQEMGGLSVGISPAKNLYEHLERYKLPAGYLDVIIYTAAGFNARNATNISSSNAIITIGGRAGTLNEFTAAYDTGKIIGILKGTGGISEGIGDILKHCEKKNSTAIVIQDTNPVRLVRRVVQEMQKRDRNPVDFDQTVL